MPVYAMIGRDGARGPELRKLYRPAHLEGLEGLEAAGRIRHAGPRLDEARAVAARDPYVVEGIFASHEVLETKVVFPRG